MKQSTKVSKPRKTKLTFKKDPEAYLEQVRERVNLTHLCVSDSQRYQEWLSRHAFLDRVLA